jgi:hypothetical protein
MGVADLRRDTSHGVLVADTDWIRMLVLGILDLEIQDKLAGHTCDVEAEVAILVLAATQEA